MNNHLEPSPSTSVQLNGFAPAAAAASGVASSSPPAAAVVVSVVSLSSTPDAVAPTGPAAAATTTTATAPAKRAAKKRGPKKGVSAGGGGGGGASASPPASSSEGDAGGLSEDTALRPLPDVGPGFEPMGLPQIRFRLGGLLEKLPRDLPDAPPPSSADRGVVATAGVSPAGVEGTDPRAQVRSFASALQIAIEEYNLLLSLVSSATYHWGVDRSGASQQNLSVMSAELQQCQDVISSVVSSRLSNVLCPAVDIMVGEIETVKGGGAGGGEEDGVGETDAPSTTEAAAPPAKRRKLPDDEDRPTPTAGGGGGWRGNERRINRYIRPLVDPSYVHLCDCILARNAAMIRHTVATSIHTAQRVIGDYLNAMKKDTSHEAGKGGYY